MVGGMNGRRASGRQPVNAFTICLEEGHDFTPRFAWFQRGSVS
jgi:hypothetical protein